MVDTGARAPKYHRVADQIRRLAASGTYKPGDQLPAETTLREEYRVSLPTIRQALAVLRAEGLIESRHGVGTFVKHEHRFERRSRARYGRARHDRQLLTPGLRHEITFAGRARAPEYVAEVLDIAPKDEVVVRRRRLTDHSGRPVEVGASYLPVEIAGDSYLEEAKVVPRALFLCVEELSGRRYVQARDRWTARMPRGHEADALDLPTGAPVMHLLHVARDKDDRVLEVSESTWPADAVVIIDEYDVEQSPTVPTVPSEI